MSTNWAAVRSRVPRFAEIAVERARLSVVPPTPNRAPTAPFVILVMAMLVAGVLGLLAFNTNMQDKAFETTRLQGEADRLTAQKQRLMLELAALRNPQALAEKAKKLGMVPPTSPAFLSLKDGKVLGDPQPAVGGRGLQINPNPQVKPAQLDPKPVVIKVPAAPSAGDAAQPAAASTQPTAQQTQPVTGASSQIR